MRNKVLGVIFAIGAAVAFWVFQQSNQKVQLSDIALENLDALTNEEVLKGKICYYSGTEKYGDYIPCKADYPDIGRCGNRKTGYYSDNRAQCYE